MLKIAHCVLEISTKFFRTSHQLHTTTTYIRRRREAFLRRLVAHHHRLQGAAHAVRRGLGLWRDLDVRTRVEREQRAPNHPGGFEHVLGITTFLCVKPGTYLHCDLVKCLCCHFFFLQKQF